MNTPEEDQDQEVDITSPIACNLTVQQARFVDEYLKDPISIKLCAIRAGYGEHSASWVGSKLLRKPHVREAVIARQKARAERLNLSEDRVIEELMKIAFADPHRILKADEEGDVIIDLGGLSREAVAALGEITVVTEKGKKKSKITKFTAIKPADRIAALEKIGKHLGMFKDKVEHSGVLSLEQLVKASLDDKSDGQ